jgi:adenylosuccinate lyase
MIERYTRAVMGGLWSDEARYRNWLEIELCACEAMAELGYLPVEAARRVRAKADFRLERIAEIEERTRHDVIAFLEAVGDFIGEDTRYLHLGMTSSDVLDTALALTVRKAGVLLKEDLEGLKAVLREKALQYKYTPMMGRSHGIHAEPMSFGLKPALWYDEIDRHQERLSLALEHMAVCKLSGAVGTFANLDPRVEEMVAQRLGLKPAPVSNQVVQRDRHAFFITTLAGIGATLEKIAVELRHLQRTEVREVEEGFAPGQKGSSAMPHKRNPIGGENITGLARLLRSYAVAALENVPLWHERDISHSSVERVIFPDATIVLDYALARTTNLIRNLQVFPENMRENLERTHGLFNSQRVMLALAGKGLAREKAYVLVQRNAMRVWQERRDFIDLLLADEEVRTYLGEEELRDCFNLDYHLKHIDFIFDRVFQNNTNTTQLDMEME